jgi:hypothetical protein
VDNHTVSTAQRQVHRQIVELSQEHPRYGYRRVTALLRRARQEINAKRVQRVRRQEGLQVSRLPKPKCVNHFTKNLVSQLTWTQN